MGENEGRGFWAEWKNWGEGVYIMSWINGRRETTMIARRKVEKSGPKLWVYLQYGVWYQMLQPIWLSILFLCFSDSIIDWYECHWRWRTRRVVLSSCWIYVWADLIFLILTNVLVRSLTILNRCYMYLLEKLVVVIKVGHWTCSLACLLNILYIGTTYLTWKKVYRM